MAENGRRVKGAARDRCRPCPEQRRPARTASRSVLEAPLIRAVRAGEFHSGLAQHGTESLAGIWAGEGHAAPAFLAEPRSPAKEEVFGILGARAPHLLPGGADQVRFTQMRELGDARP
ncbi:hypothetical protein [Streptomyces sp. NPDC057616]|uniref:hypothetical protein n=1 Tax=Streptomyces sp. NPDC057616 TaxID=3346183 RepID=UPI0036777884